jgi:hypothetical protein
MRQVILITAGAVVFGCIFFAGGCYTGRLLRTREEVRVNIPVYVRMYNDLLSGRLDRATNYLGVYLMDQTKRYDELQGNALLRLATARTYFESTSFQVSLSEARKIAAQQATNMVWIGPTKNTDSTAVPHRR